MLLFTFLVLVTGGFAYLACYLHAGFQEILVLLALTIAAFYRYYERKSELSKYEGEDTSIWEKYFQIKQNYKLAQQEHRLTWWNKERNRICDYFNISRAMHERKRDKLVASMMQMNIEEFPPPPYDDPEQIKPYEERMLKTYLTADLMLEIAKELRNIEQVGKIIKRHPPKRNKDWN